MSGNLAGVQAPVLPVPVQPGRGAQLRQGVQPRPRLGVLDWKVEALRRLGLQSKVPAQTTLATGTAGIKAGLFTPAGANAAATLTNTVGHPADALFDAYLQALDAFEQNAAKDDPARQIVKAAADAFLKRRKPIGSNRDPLSTAREAACRQTLVDLRRDALCDDIAGVGAPPWDAAKSMQVASLKATLDFESLPIGQQTASLNGEAGVTTSLWINQAAGVGGKQKTFIFKPQMADEVNDFPPGGEPVREAMVGRAADLLNGVGFGIAMPETHVIALSSDRIPPEAATEISNKAMQKAGPLVGSLQSFSAATGDMKQTSRDTMRAIPTTVTQNLAVMDIISLNCDRHAGNLLTTGGNPPSIVPIDHGLAFPPITQLFQLRDKMAGAHNALLGLAGSHEPFDPAVLANIALLDPEVFAGALRKELTTLDTAQPALAGTLDTTAIDASKRSMQFLKRAAPTLTPAAIQIAIGRNAETLFDPALDPGAFDALADAIILKMVPEQGAIAEYFQMTSEQKDVVFKRLKQNGWVDEIGFSVANGPLITDIAALMALFHSNVQKLPPQPAPPPANIKVTPERLAKISADFPKTPLRTPQQQQEALAAMRDFEALGMTTAAMTTFVRENGLDPSDFKITMTDVVRLTKFHKQANKLKMVIAVTPAPTMRQAVQSKLDFLDRLMPLLPANADPDIALTAAQVRTTLQLTVRAPQDARLSDYNERMKGAVDSAYDSARDRLHRIISAMATAGRFDDKAKQRLNADIDEGNLLSTFAQLAAVDPALGGA